MNGVIVCDSYYGNTAQVAEALAEDDGPLADDAVDSAREFAHRFAVDGLA